MRLIIDFILWFIWVPMRKLVVRIPLPVVSITLRACSSLLYAIDKKRREGVKEELRLLFDKGMGEDEINRTARSSFYIFARKVYENLLYGEITKRGADSIFTFQGTHHLDEALKKGKGVMLISLHFGSFFLSMLGLGLRGYKANAITGTPLIEASSYIKNKIYALRKEEESRYPFKVVVVGNSLKPLLTALKRNEIAGVVIDGREATKMIPVKFLERTAQFSPSLVNLSMRTGAVILPFIAIMGKDGRHNLIVSPALEMTSLEDKEEAARVNLERLVGIFEKYVSEHPDHYAMTLYGMREESRLGAIPPFFVDSPRSTSCGNRSPMIRENNVSEL
ncbi:MAG: lysophospholipid acyltransferase family protein [Nitrospirae bacterium]|nr:lysophospholipid acyltransferase family protein [Nitrospirota bacterium]